LVNDENGKPFSFHFTKAGFIQNELQAEVHFSISGNFSLDLDYLIGCP